MFYGWVIVAGAFVVLFMAYGVQYSFGIFFSAMLDEFHWSRASLAGAFSLYTFTYCSFGLLAGRLTDRWGPRAVIAVGAGFLGVGLTAMSGVSQVWHPYVLYGLVAAVGMSTAYVPCSATVARWFVRRRGLAVGLASGGMALGTLLMPLVANGLTVRIGWRWAYVVFGVGVFAVVSVVATLIRRDPESSGLFPDGDSSPPRHDSAGSGHAVWTLGAAMRTRALWMLFGIFAATWTPVFGPFVHLVPMARGLGISPMLAASLLSALGLGALVGRLAMGAVSDRVGRRAALAAGLALQVGSFAALSASHTLHTLYAAALLFGFSYGAVSVQFPALIADFFGRAHAGSIVGLLFASAGAVAAWGPFAAGWIYDRSGSYGLAWWCSAGFNGFALLLLAFTRAPGGRDAPPARLTG